MEKPMDRVAATSGPREVAVVLTGAPPSTGVSVTPINPAAMLPRGKLIAVIVRASPGTAVDGVRPDRLNAGTSITKASTCSKVCDPVRTWRVGSD